MNCEIQIATRKKNTKEIVAIFKSLFEIKIEEVEK